MASQRRQIESLEGWATAPSATSQTRRVVDQDIVRLVDPKGPRTPSVSVVIPAMNEAENLFFVLPLLPPEVTEVVLVDGSSEDGTVEVARRLYPGVKVVPQQGQGKGN